MEREKKRYKFERVVIIALKMDALVTILLLILASMSHYAYGVHLI